MTTARERPILFSGPMVGQLVAGLKTQTRRRQGLDPANRCRFGVPGDRLWVKETHSTSALGVYPCPSVWYRADFGAWTDPTRKTMDHVNGCKGNNADCFPCAAEREGPFRWKPSIFMRRRFSRLTLGIVAVRTEQVQSISVEDIAAEGVTPSVVRALWNGASRKKRLEMLSLWNLKPKTIPDFNGWTTDLWPAGWVLINGRESWESNPFVWAIEFRRLPQ